MITFLQMQLNRCLMPLGCWMGSMRCLTSLRDLEVPSKYNNVKVILQPSGWLRLQPTDKFRLQLENCVAQWKDENKSAAWLVVPPELGWTIHSATQCGFSMHHVKQTSIYMMKWLEKGTESRVPPFATHQVGVAGFVMDDQNRVLVIREKHASYLGYKLPGGLADHGEDFGETAQREVFEETGVHCSFESLLSLRHQHNVGFGVSDLYIVCRCRALTTDIQKCPHEIAEVRWLTLADYISQTSDMNAMIARLVMEHTQEYESASSPIMHNTHIPYELREHFMRSVDKKRQYRFYIAA